MKLKCLAWVLCAASVLTTFAACGSTVTTEKTSETPLPQSESETAAASSEAPTDIPTVPTEPSETPTAPPETETVEPTLTPYVFPENGVLKLIPDGSCPFTADGRNPALSGDNLLIYFDFALRNAGLDLADDVKINYTVKNAAGEQSQGSSALDTSVAEIKNEYGYIGLCLPIGVTLNRYEKVTFELSFADASGKEYTVKNQTLYKGLTYLGMDAESFKMDLPDVTTVVTKNVIKQSANVGGTDFTFTINLGGWAGKTTSKQIHVIACLFWDVYPKMHARFAPVAKSPTNVVLKIEDFGYEIASTGGNEVHIHDGWLKQNKTDYDCLTHEFAHVIQNGWNGNYCEYSDYIERFADYCRYIYAYNDGEYNDSCWTMQTVSDESTLEKSVRFLAWLDYFYSTSEKDLVLEFFRACYSKKYPREKWNDAWAEIFKGTALEGKTQQEAFEMYAESEFAKLSTQGNKKKVSALLQQYNVREKIKGEV